MQAIRVLEKYLHVGVLTQLFISSLAVARVSLDNITGIFSLSKYMSVDLMNLVPTTFYGMPVMVSTPTPTPTPLPANVSAIISSVLPSWLQGYTPTGSLSQSAGQSMIPWSIPYIQNSMFTSAPVQAGAYHFPFMNAFPSFAQGLGSFMMFAAAILISLWAVGGWAVWGGVWYIKSKKK